MKMYFHFGLNDTLLFKGLVLDSRFKIWAASTVLFLLSFIYEYIKYVRSVKCGCQASKQSQVVAQAESTGSSCCMPQTSNGTRCNADNNTGSELMIAPNRDNCFVSILRNKRHRFLDTLLHTLQMAIGYILMLSVMTYNVCIIFAILMGKFQSVDLKDILH